MATRMRARVARRPSLPLTEQDERDLERIRTSPAYRSALTSLSGETGEATTAMSEAALLHAVFKAGLDAIRLAAEQSTDAEIRRAAARRRRPSWADEG